MRITRVERSTDLPYGFVFGLVTLLFGVMTYFLYPYLPAHVKICYFHEITGIPCPTCGVTRSGLALFAGDLKTAFLSNPLFYILGLVMVTWMIASLLFEVLPKKRFHFELAGWEKAFLRILFITAVLVNWYYLIWSGV